MYRLFGALLVLLLLMALAVGLIRLRSDPTSGSPYGSLATLAGPGNAPTAAAPPSQASPSQIPPVASVVPAPAADPTPPLSRPAAPPPLARDVKPPVAPPAAIVIAPTPAAAPAGVAPRRIALDKAAAGSAFTQPAPPAVVEAATRAAAAPPARTPTPAPRAPVLASTEETPPAAAPSPTEKSESSSGRININTASVEQLDRLGGGRIGAWIARHRPYRSIDDLVAHRVLKARDFARIQAAITAN